MNNTTIKMEDLKDAIGYFGEGCEDFLIFAIQDDKAISNPKHRTVSLTMKNLGTQVEELLCSMEDGKLGIFFYPNGASKDIDVTEIGWHYVDIDGGDKEEQLKRILEAPLQPTMVYSGRAGHKLLYRVTDAYWDISTPEALQQSIAHFKNVQQQLVEYFGGDGNVKNPAHALRLPFVKNYKYWREEVYKEEVIFFHPENIYTQGQIMETFPECSIKHRAYLQTDSNELSEEQREILDCLKDYLEENGLSYTDYGDRIACQCPIHDDSSPSAFLYKNSMVMHCSNGKAGGDCEIGNGKSLEWVAKYMEWDNLHELLMNWKSVKEANYLTIELAGMRSNQILSAPAHREENTKIVEGVLKTIHKKFLTRGITLDEKWGKVYRNMTRNALLQNASPLCVPLPPGGGKSTWMHSFSKYRLEHDLDNAGAVIVVERIEAAKQIAAELGVYTIQKIEGGAIDLPSWHELQSAYVMESAHTSEHCIKDLKEYTYGVCRGCTEYHHCPTARKYTEQKKYPIVILTHARLTMDGEDLEKYSEWVDINGNSHRRKILIIDEKPPLAFVYSLTSKDVLEFETQLKAIEQYVDDLSKTKQIVLEISQMFAPPNEDGEVEAIDPEYSFESRNAWYKHYSGSDVGIVDKIEHLVRQGGRLYQNQSGTLTINVTSTKRFSYEGYTTLILDGTSLIDMEYRIDERVHFMDIPKDIRTYENLILNVAPCSLGKTRLRGNADLLGTLAGEIVRIAEQRKTLVLCHKEYEDSLKAYLSKEIATGKIQINHFGNVKGSNDYSGCTALVLVGILHKGDPFYISKHDALYGATENTATTTINDVRRFNDPRLERVKLNDQLTSLIQDICRTALRNKDHSDPIHVFVPTKDQVLVNLLIQYFTGATASEWRISELERNPDWFEPVSKILSALKSGERVTKKEIREVLGWISESGARRFRRMAETNQFQEMLKQYSIVEENARTYVQL